MNKKGFAFIETIITVVILSASLLYIYSSYTSIINDEQTRIYYDDVAYLYKTNYVRNFLFDYTNIEKIMKSGFDDSYILKLGQNFDNLFDYKQLEKGMKASFENIIKTYNINQILLIKTTMLDDCVEETDNCKRTQEVLNDYNLREYVNSLNDNSHDFYLVVEYDEKLDESGKVSSCTPGIDKKCTSYFTSLALDSVEGDDDKLLFSDFIKSQFTTQGANGLYYHDNTLANGANDNSYRYVGANPNNYVCFGYDDPAKAYASDWCPEDNLYRIIGVFNDKIVGTDGNLTGAKEERVKLIKAYEAGESVLGKAADYTDTPWATYYKGKRTSIPYYRWGGSSSNTSNIWANSTLNTETLNGITGNTYLTKIGEYASKIATTRWQVGGATEAQLSTVTAKVAYQNEVGSPINNTIQDSKIGLLYVSEYMYAADPTQKNAWSALVGYNGGATEDYRVVKDYNYLYLGVKEWTISCDSDRSDTAFYVNIDGIVTNGYGVGGSNVVRPTFSLLNSVAYAGGSGTETDPFRII